LNAAEQIVLRLEQVVPWHRDAGHVGRLALLVTVQMPSLGPLFKKLRPGRVRFTDENHIRQAVEVIFLHSDRRTADDREDAAGFQFTENLGHPMALDVHTGEPHNVGPRHKVVVDWLDVLIDNRHAMAVRRQRGQQRQADIRENALLTKQRKCVFEAPVRHIESRIDKHDIGHKHLLRPEGRVAVLRKGPVFAGRLLAQSTTTMR
jgi:hypothetical protein